MSEPVILESSTTAADEERSAHSRRWFRLLRSVLLFGGFVTLISFVDDCFWNFWDHNLSVEGFTRELLVRWLTKAFVEGLFIGLFFGLPTWLAREHFPRPKRRSR